MEDSCLIKKHGQNPGVVGPEDPGLRKVGLTEDLSPDEDWHIIGAVVLVTGVKHPSRACRVRDLLAPQLHTKR